MNEQHSTGPHCGNNPNFKLGPGDQQAVDEFKAYLQRRAAGGPPERDPFTPPAHYRRDDGVDCCVHTIPAGPGSCPACRELYDEEQP